MLEELIMVRLNCDKTKHKVKRYYGGGAGDYNKELDSLDRQRYSDV